MNKHAARILVLTAHRRAGFAEVTYADRSIRNIKFPSKAHSDSARKAKLKWLGKDAVVWLLSFWRKPW